MAKKKPVDMVELVERAIRKATAKAILRRLLFGTPQEVEQAEAMAAKLFETKDKEPTDG